MDKLYFAALRPGAKIPAKRDEDAGYDIYACFDEDFIKILPHETKIIPSGIISACSQDSVAILTERGSTGIRGIGQRSGVIDSGYRGEWLISLTNHNEAPLVIAKSGYAAEDGEIVYPYEKAICQAVFVPLARLEATAVTAEFVQGIGSERGSGRLGSSEK
jgi:dUTP pyrophosphatase